MMLAVDVHYHDRRAHVAGVAFARWSSPRPLAVYGSDLNAVPAYVSGEFYKRELPGILTLLRDHGLSPATIVIDGYVYLDGVSTPGLGSHLFDALNGRVRIVGVAKRPLSGIGGRHAILRGSSSRPLFVTAQGMPLARARQCILSMHGDYRIPTLLKIADQASRRYASGGGITGPSGA